MAQYTQKYNNIDASIEPVKLSIFKEQYLSNIDLVITDPPREVWRNLLMSCQATTGVLCEFNSNTRRDIEIFAKKSLEYVYGFDFFPLNIPCRNFCNTKVQGIIKCLTKV